MGATLLAGCASSVDVGPGTGSTSAAGASQDPGDVSADLGSFRLLVSDRPADIGDFDSLVVSFDRARIFRAGGDDDEPADASGDETTTTATETTEADTPTAEPTETPAATTSGSAATESPTSSPSPEATATVGEEAEGEDEEEEEASEDPSEADDEAGGFSVIDLTGASTDLTQLVGAKATSVYEGELPVGRYTKLELYVDDVEGLVDGGEVDVTVPSGKLMLTKPFEVASGGSVSFVFDINVVRKGRGGYNLLPVIGESGVAGRDVEVEEVPAGTAGTQAEGSEPASPSAEETGDGDGDGDGGPPEDAASGGPPEGPSGDGEADGTATPTATQT